MTTNKEEWEALQLLAKLIQELGTSEKIEEWVNSHT